MINPYAQRQRFMTVPLANSSVNTASGTVPMRALASAKHVSTNGTSDADLQLGHPSWGLPREIVAQFNSKGINKLYSWQRDCLLMPGVLSGGNLVYCAPTSGGKSLVAEILLLRRIVYDNAQTSLLVVPFVSLVEEKYTYLRHICRVELCSPTSGVRRRLTVKKFHGNKSANSLGRANICVCTPEKATVLVNHLMQAGKLSQIGCVVIDEMHLLGDKGRGYKIEQLLTKLRAAWSTSGGAQQHFQQHSDEAMMSMHSSACADRFSELRPVQLIGLSATLPNVHELAQWLDAQLFHTRFRPVNLAERIKIGNELIDTDGKHVRCLREVDGKNVESEHVAALCSETVNDGGQVLVFCPSQDSSRQCAIMLAERAQLKIQSGRERTTIDSRKLLIQSLQNCSGVGLDQRLPQQVLCGIAYHHAGLTLDERCIIERGYREGTIVVLACTATLSTGVNLPARRVILRTPRSLRGKGCILTPSVYKQMCGRAGRAGLDKSGESIFFAGHFSRREVLTFVNEQPKPLCSCLAASENGLSRVLLEVIAGNLARSRTDVELVVRQTLLFQQDSKAALHDAQRALEFLEKKQCIEWDDKEQLYATKLGLAIFNSSLDPEEGCVLLAELRRARSKFMIGSCPLHLLYTVTPLFRHTMRTDYRRFNTLYPHKFSDEQRKVAEIVGIDADFIQLACSGHINVPLVKQQSCSVPNEFESKCIRHARFYNAMILSEIVREKPLAEVAKLFGSKVGKLETLQKNTVVFARTVIKFCTELRWMDIAALAKNIAPRIELGSASELVPLSELKSAGLTTSIARAMYDKGLSTVIRVACAPLSDIESIVRFATPFELENTESDREYSMRRIAFKVQYRARELVHEQAHALQSSTVAITADSRSDDDTSSDASDQDGNDDCTNYNDNNFIACLNGHVGKSSSSKIADNDMHHGDAINWRPAVDWLRCTDVIRGAVDIDDFWTTWRKQSHFAVALVYRAPPLCYDPKRWQDDLPQCNTSHMNASDGPKILCGLAVAWEEEHAWYLQLPPRLPPIFAQIVSDNVTTGTCRRSRMAKAHENVLSCKCDGIGQLSHVMLTHVLKFVGISGFPSTPDVRIQRNNFCQVCKTWAICHCAAYNELWDKHIGPRWLSLRSILEKKDKTIAAYDMAGVLRSFARCGISIKAVLADPKVAHWLLEPTEEIKCSSLDQLFQKYFKMGNGRPRRHTTFMERACTSAAYTHRLTIHLVRRLQAEQLQDCFFRREMPLAHTIADMETWGMGVALQYLQALRNVADEKRRMLEARAATFGLEIKAGDQVAALRDTLYTILQLKPPHNFKDKTGKQEPFPVCREALEAMHDQHVLPGIVNEWRKLSSLSNNALVQKKYSRYMRKIRIDSELQERVLYRADTSSATGRMLVHHPPLQHVTKEQTFDTARRFSVHQELASNPSLVDHINFDDAEATRAWVVSSQSVGDDGYFCPRHAHIVYVSTRNITEPLECGIIPAMVQKDVHSENTSSPATESLLKYWRKQGHNYSPQVAASVRQIVVSMGWHPLARRERMRVLRNGQSGSGVTVLTYPADRVFRQAVKPTCHGSIECEAPSCWPRQFVVNVRNAFVASQGCVLVSADYAQLEARIMAHFSQEPALLKVLHSNSDLFRGIAAKWQGCRAADVTQEMRNDAKSLCYGILYGMGPKTLALKVDNGNATAAFEMRRTFYDAFPGLKRWEHCVISRAKHDGFVTTLAGRRRYLPDINSPDGRLRSRAERQAVNTICQGSAADLIKRPMIRLRERLSREFPPRTQSVYTDKKHGLETTCPRIRLVMQVHDELIFEVPDDPRIIANAVSIIKEEMCSHSDLRAPLVVKLGVGKRWGQLMSYQEAGSEDTERLKA